MSLKITNASTNDTGQYTCELVDSNTTLGKDDVYLKEIRKDDIYLKDK